jgi:hypothetical protein
LAPQALFTQSSPVRKLLLQAFPFLSTLGEVTLRPLSQAGVFIYSSCGKWVFPPLLWSFPPTSTFINFPAPECWACAVAPAFSAWLVYLQLTWEVVFLRLLWSFPPTAAFTSFPTLGCWACAAAPAFSRPACLFIVPWGIPLPPFRHSGCYMSLLHVFFVIAYYSVSLFSLGGGWSVQGAMLIWPRVVFGSTAYRLAHLVFCVFPSCLDASVWWHRRSAPGFYV